MKKLTTILTFIILTILQSYAQNQELDSLQNLLLSAKHDTTRVKIYTQLSEICEEKNMKEFTEKAIGIASVNFNKKISKVEKNTYNKYLTTAYNNLGYYHDFFGNKLLAIDNFNKSIKLSDEIGDLHGKASTLINIGSIHLESGAITKGLECFHESLKLFETLNDKEGIAYCYIFLGSIYQSQADFKKSLHYYNKSLEIRIQFNDKNAIATSYNNVGLIHYYLNEYDKALENYKNALKLQIEDKKIGAITYFNIGALYEKQNLLKDALSYYFESLKLQEELKNKEGIAYSYNNISEIYFKLGNNQKALEYAKKSYKLSNELGYPDIIKNTAKILSNIYERQNNTAEALKMYKIHVVMRDSIFNINNQKISIQKDLQYNFDKKSIADSLQSLAEKQLIHEKLENEKTQKYFLYAGIVSVLFFLGFVYNRYKNSQTQKNIIQTQKETVEKQKQIVEEKNHEITQSIEYAKHIQTALLPTELMFKQSFTDSFVLFKPKDIVSGDFYWISDRKDFIFYATADSTGHGVPGGFMSMLGTALLNEIIDERNVSDCGEVLTLMRERIMQALKQAGNSNSKDGMDMVLIRINKNTLEMEYAAANNSFYIVKRHETQDMRQEISSLTSHISHLEELPCDKMPVGVYHSEVKPFQTFSFQLSAGDIIYTYTDGYADQFGGEKGKKFTYKRLREKLLAISQETLAEQKLSLESEFENWRNNEEQIDDICLIGVKI